MVPVTDFVHSPVVSSRSVAGYLFFCIANDVNGPTTLR
ncbi:Uncharacterised protein [Serratia marcescens]|uniref:Uncharacterized protein n=1 Tax=Serratia marcescens TaxID=615 RepID=A0A380ATL7_SERMA|nr:Uncharacterised protein [Serratia marcescens]